MARSGGCSASRARSRHAAPVHQRRPGAGPADGAVDRRRDRPAAGRGSGAGKRGALPHGHRLHVRGLDRDGRGRRDPPLERQRRADSGKDAERDARHGARSTPSSSPVREDGSPFPQGSYPLMVSLRRGRAADAMSSWACRAPAAGCSGSRSTPSRSSVPASGRPPRRRGDLRGHHGAAASGGLDRRADGADPGARRTRWRPRSGNWRPSTPNWRRWPCATG